MGQFDVEDGQKEYFRVRLRLNDYRPAEERRRLALVLYFRLVILASAQGFFAVHPPDCEKVDDGQA